MDAPIPCPECGAPIMIDETAEKEITVVPGYFIVGLSVVERRRVPCVVGFCTGCEFAIEVVL